MRPVQDCRRLCFSYLLLVALGSLAWVLIHEQWLPSIISGIQPFIGGNFQAAVQSTGGPEYIASLIFIVMACSFFSRHVNRFFSFQRLIRTVVISPTTITAASFVLSGNDRVGTKPQVQLFALLTFSTASFLRFSGVDDYDAEFSMRRRLFSRLMEYLLYFLFAKQSTICRLRILLPLGFQICACRSNEVFRIWQLRQQSLADFHDHQLAWERMRQFYGMAMASLLGNLTTTRTDSYKIENWPGSIQNATQSYPAEDNVDAIRLINILSGTNYKDRFDEIKQEILAEGLYGRTWKPNNQYGFMWADGSGVAMASAMAVVAQIIFISVQILSDLHHTEQNSFKNRGPLLIGDILLCSVSTGLFLYLLIQSIPGLILVLDMAIQNSWNQDTSMNDWAEWFRQIYGFCGELLVQGHPGPDHMSEKSRVKAEDSVLEQVIRGAEGIELVPYVILYAAIRVLAMGIFLIPLYYLSVGTRSVLGFSNISTEGLKRMSLMFAKVTAWDAIRAKSTIIRSEVLLNTRMVTNYVPNFSSTSTNFSSSSNIATFECTEPLQLQILLDDLHKILEGDPSNPTTIIKPLCAPTDKIGDVYKRKQAINEGLFSSILEELDNINLGSNNTKAKETCNQYAKPILDLLSQIYFNTKVANSTTITTREEYDKNAKEVIKILKEFGIQSRWDKVKNHWTQNGIMNEIDIQIMRIQLELSMLLFNFYEPSVVVPSITGRILNEWFEARRSQVKGIGFCDFIKDIQGP